MKFSLLGRVALALGAASSAPSLGFAQQNDNSRVLHWRQIGPTRAGRARALAGVPSQPNVFYVGFDNGGVWRSTDYGSTWVPLFDEQPTGSIGAIAVAPSDPNIIYVGIGRGHHPPGPRDGRRRLQVHRRRQDVDAPRASRHADDRDDRRRPARSRTGSSSRRSATRTGLTPSAASSARPTAGRSFQKVLYKDEYTSGNDVRIDPSDPNIVYATLWQQQQSFIEGQGFGGAGNGIFKSTDGGTTWKQLTDGLPSIIQANIALAPSNPQVAVRDGRRRRLTAGGAAARRRDRPGVVGLLQVDRRAASTGRSS